MKDAASKTTGRFAPRPGADESRLRLVLETMQDAFVEIDGDGTITDWNRAAEVLFGWTRDEVLGRGLHDTIVAEQLREALGAAVDDFTSGGEEAITGRRLELPAVDRTGREFAAELSITPMRVGRAWRFAAFLRDASDRAPARQPLDVGHVTERVARLGSWHWVPLTGEMRFSEGLCRILGEDPRAYDPAQEMRLERVHPDDRERVRRTLDAACVAGDELETEFRVLRSDGEIRSLHVRGTLLRDAEGTHVRSMGTAQDVTERVRAEARNRRLAALVKSTDDAVLSADREGRITSWNEAAQRLYGYGEHEVLGRPMAMLVPPAKAGEEQLLLRRVLSGERVERVETQHVRSDGRPVDVWLTLSPVLDATGRMAEASAIVRDITEQKRAERERERYVAELEALARRDSLTGLLTRRELQGLLEAELRRAERAGSECSLLVVDVDDLAAVNDRDGRQAGDAVLRALADVVRRAAPDLAPCRLTDDDIAIVLPGMGAGAAMALAQKIKQAWRATPRAAEISSGVATWPHEASQKEELVEQAFAALAFDKPGEANARKADDALGTAGDGDALEQVLGLLRRHLGMELVYLSEFCGDEQIIRLVDAGPGHPEIVAGATVPLRDGPCRFMVDGELPNVVCETAGDPVARTLPIIEQSHVGSYVGVPVRLSDGTLYGSLCAASRDPRPDLGAHALHFAQVCARLVGDMVEQRALETHNRRLQSELTGVRALLAALDARDHYTGAHSEAVVALAAAVGRRLDLAPADLAAVEQVALLHDIGKIGVPDSILQKPGPLDDGEWKLMREHPAIGARIVKSITSLDHLAPAIRAEHERWDGRGYPDGLRREDIPLASRIILACDALHAMTSDRPYRAAMPLADAEAELRANAGIQFDPDVVEALLAELRPEQVDPPTEEPITPSGRPTVLVVEDNASFRLALEAGLESEGFAVNAVGDAAEAYRIVRDVDPDLVLLDWILPGGDGGAAACRRIRQMCPEAEVVIFTGLGDVRDQRAAREAGASKFLQKGMPLQALVEHLQIVLTSR
ncbi:MAG: diguanylate cyclase/phosphodiesterase (GGDEF & EAL domains) with PAS/PAC sensor(s) [uncultured Solirubrobacteraceae bacterium]|uniref:Diguanylate cyclase/phosphodiesterase (GGDEF & EAL domains) with PAS/PAC sensor(S) n=1 Tax=uncultured Solirubrobacteraceae bacterium TaxID=1162706 RepID=A0A6J4SZT5_9ACTN|nr:MAG: diguanylate cyclase/phosphodiesterase (GGDEF & EAL domains) with PAS/PAC sensor(s) [uncultured Solirubrobacteraceae bacterium]